MLGRGSEKKIRAFRRVQHFARFPPLGPLEGAHGGPDCWAAEAKNVARAPVRDFAPRAHETPYGALETSYGAHRPPLGTPIPKLVCLGLAGVTSHTRTHEEVFDIREINQRKSDKGHNVKNA